MGHTITDEGVSIDDRKVKAIQGMSPPTDIKSLRSFLGMVNYMSKFIPNLAAESKVLRDLEKKDVDWKWTDEHQKCFRKLQVLIATDTKLSFFNPSLEI